MQILFLSFYSPRAPRDKNTLLGLRKRGVRVFEVVSARAGLRKYVDIAKEYQRARRADAVIVGYQSGFLVPLARLLGWGKMLVYNAGNPQYDGLVLDRGIYPEGTLRARFVWWMDWLAFRAANVVLLETEAQIEYVTREFGIPRAKLLRVWTGADGEVFHPDAGVQKKQPFLVVFRGFFVPATGVEQVLEAARLLKDENISFRLIGRGPLSPKVEQTIREQGLSRVEIISQYLTDDEMRTAMLEGEILLGQFGGHERLERTIQHKTFEALALGVPFITGRTKSNEELLGDGETVQFVSLNSSEELAEAIRSLAINDSLRASLGAHGRELFLRLLQPEQIVAELAKRIA